jgi:bifunctional non-homologous end joining protein LigD
VIRYGISGLPAEDDEPGAFLDALLERGQRAFELGFTQGFPWKERQCRRFGDAAATRGIRLSVHAPYFAILTVEDDDRSKQCVAAIEHTMKLCEELRAPVVVAHLGHIGGRSPSELMGLMRTRLEWIDSKTRDLRVSLGLETAGNDSSFGTLGDIALLAGEFPFVRPVIDWAHVHAMTGAGLTSREAFDAVLDFIDSEFAGWKTAPLQCQFSDNQVGDHGEIRHVAYGEGTLRIGPLVEAATARGLDLVIISESREAESHRLIQEELDATVSATPVPPGELVGVLDGAPLLEGRVSGDRHEVGRGRRPLRVSNIDKRYFGATGHTKGDVLQYYAGVADLLVPHLAGRPMSMSRYPEGIDGPTFYEKRAPGHQPEWIRTVDVPSESARGAMTFMTADDRESLLWFANMACIEMHPFHTRAAMLDRPDWAIFDLDPSSGSTWEQVVVVAKMIRTVLERLGLRGYPKLSGSRGVHIYVPLDPVHTFERVRGFVGAVGSLLEQANPDDVTMAWDKKDRTGRVFVDHNRNAFGQTIASVYSVRPRPGAPVSVPLRWDELDRFGNESFTVDNIWSRLAEVGDVFSPVWRGGQTLDAAETALGLS